MTMRLPRGRCYVTAGSRFAVRGSRLDNRLPTLLGLPVGHLSSRHDQGKRDTPPQQRTANSEPRTAVFSLTCLLLLLAVAAPAAESARVIRGPWWWHAADGAPHVGVAVAGPAEIPSQATLDGRSIPLTGELRPLPAANDGADGVVVLHLPVGCAGALRLELAGAVMTMRLRPPPAANAPARLALAGGRAWPDRVMLDALGRAMGGPAQLVLALGAGVPARLGTGGWESDIPIAVVAPADPALAACSGGDDAAWRHGLRLGLLGLPASPDRARADLALARDLSPWLVYLDAPAGWDPAISERRPSDPSGLGVLLAACQRLKVPLALGAGASGFVSEPLAMQAGGSVGIAAGGVRYVLPTPAADQGLGRLPSEIALPLEQPMLAGLAATIDELRLLIVHPGEAEPVHLDWRRSEDGEAAKASALRQLVTAAESLDTPEMRQAIATWTWLTRQDLSAAMPDAEQIARLRDEGGSQGRTLARRLALIALDDPQVAAVPGDADPLVARDHLLWKLATVRGGDAISWRDQAAATTDPVVLRALLADLARDEERTVLPALVARVALQAAGTLPLDPDPIDEHNLCAAVFDDVHLSPTPLRPWALILRDQVDPLARGPIERFLERHGEMRPVP